MDNVQFEEEKVNSQFFRKSQVYSGLIGLVIKAKLAKNEVQANLVLVVTIIICIVGVVFILIGKSYSKPTNVAKPLTAEQFRELMIIRR